jgi:hypothetical protein
MKIVLLQTASQLRGDGYERGGQCKLGICNGTESTNCITESNFEYTFEIVNHCKKGMEFFGGF